MDRKNVLLDTNVFIALEDTNKELSDLLANIKKLCQENNVHLCIHPVQKKIDIENDTDIERKKLLKSRLNQYPELDIDFQICQQGKTNDYVDEILLDAVSKNAIHYFVTEDIKLHKKAKRHGLGSRLFYIKQFENWLAILQPEADIVYDLKDEFLYKLNPEDSFFDSLKDAYSEFVSWFKKVSREQRKAWIISKGKQTNLGAICIYKIEQSESKKHLKLCTFKVADFMQGQKIGERLFYQSFIYAVRHSCDSVYIEINPKGNTHLVNLCEEYGFEEDCIKEGSKDIIYRKPMSAPANVQMDAFDYSVKYYPHYLDGQEISKYIIPIIPKYHRRLFPDTYRDLFNLNYSEGRAIKKAYICHAPVRKLKQGDIVLFYQSEKQTVGVLGVIEQVQIINQDGYESLEQAVVKRTVYSKAELKELSRKECLVILFRLIKTLDKPIALPKSISPPRSIKTLKHQEYCQYFKERFQL